MRNTKLLYRFFAGFAVLALVIILLLVYLVAKGFYNLQYRHELAFNRWETRKPNHYSYVLAFNGALIYQDYLVEVSGGNLVKLTDLITGISTTSIPQSAPTSFSQTSAWVSSNLLIDDLFLHIQGATRPPSSVGAFLSRVNPSLYGRFSSAGWIPLGVPTCDPAYPRVSYHPVYGYPEDLELPGSLCRGLIDAGIPVYIKIDAFQLLP